MKMPIALIVVFTAFTGLAWAGLPSKADLLRKDEDRNGSLDRTEMGQLSDDQRHAAIDAYDSNHDGEISASELTAGPKKEEADKNKDGKGDKDGKKGKKKGGKKGGKKDGNKGGNGGNGGGGGGGNGGAPAIRKAGK